MLRTWHRAQLLCQKCIFTKIEDGGRRHLEFRKNVAIFSLLDQSAPNLEGMSRIWYKTHCFVKKCTLLKFKMVATAILNFDKLLPIPHYWTDLHQIWWGPCKFYEEHNCKVEKAHSIEFKMAAAAILHFENVSHSFAIWPILTKLGGDFCKFDVECICWVGNEHEDQIGSWRLSPYWISKRCGHFITIKPLLTEHVVNMKCRLAGRKTANINVKNYISLKHDVYRPDSSYKTAKMIYQKYSH